MARVLLSIAAVALVSCAETQSPGYMLDGRVGSVSAGDVQLALQAARQRFQSERRAFMRVFRVQVTSADEIYIYCGPHYGGAIAAGGVTVRVQRIDGKWRATSLTEEPPTYTNERVIFT
jgi:hypothetical protein